MDLDITSPKQLNRKVFLKQLAVDLCNSEQRILFRAQYVSTHFTYTHELNCYHLTFNNLFASFVIKPDIEEKIKGYEER